MITVIHEYFIFIWLAQTNFAHLVKVKYLLGYDEGAKRPNFLLAISILGNFLLLNFSII